MHRWKKFVSISYFCKMVILYLKCTRWMFRNIGWKPKLYLVIIYVVQSQRDTKKAEHNLSVGIRDSFTKTPIYSIPHSLNQPLSLGRILFKLSTLLFDHISYPIISLSSGENSAHKNYDIHDSKHCISKIQSIYSNAKLFAFKMSVRGTHTLILSTILLEQRYPKLWE